MSRKHKPKQIVTVDTLSEKREQLELFRGQFAATVAMVTQTIDDLGALNTDMDRALDEIEDYQKSLEGLRLEILESKVQNEKVIKNFKSLLEIE